MSSPAPRLAWVDNLRTAIILMVVHMHACVTYSHVGSWYINEGPEPSLPVKAAFIFWQAHLQAFFMGVLYFLAGFFAHRSLARHGTGRFLRERAIRLGLPSLLYMLVIHPFMVYVLLGHPRIPQRPPLGWLYLDYLTSGRVLSGNGPLWFALGLLAFCLVLACWRVAVARSKCKSDAPEAAWPAPGPAALLAFGCALVAATFAMRLVQPLGTNVLNFQLCFFPQYTAAFAAGVAAGRGGWLEELIASRRARIAGWLGLIGGPLLLAIVVILGGPPSAHGPGPYVGGWHGQAFGLAGWEQLAGLGLGLGVLVVFRKRINQDGPIARWLSARAFAVYVLHPPVLVALTPWLRPLKLDPFTHMAVLTVLGLAASCALADVARRIPGLRAIL
jgi:peptidoglycan/LPS O-acetylase OafA/YrhL